MYTPVEYFKYCMWTLPDVHTYVRMYNTSIHMYDICTNVHCIFACMLD